MQARSEARVAVSITAPTWPDALAAIARAGSLADLIEIRFDCLEDCNLHQQAEEILRQAVAASPLPLIFTHRSGRPETAPNSTAQTVSQLLSARKTPLARDYFDFDLSADNSIGFNLYTTYLRLFEAYPQIILSHHNFDSCNERDLMSAYSRIATFTPDLIKIAAQAARVDDLLGIFALLDRARSEGRAACAVAMGTAGRISRILGPSRGSFLTFAALEPGTESAPGQFSIEEMLSLYRIKSITQETAVYALLGNPVGHSVSPHMHNAAFAALGLDAVYLPIALASEELATFIERFVRPTTRAMRWPFRGASVTVPHKVQALSLIDEADPVAKSIGAINTITVNGEKLRGYNTDVVGAMAPLKKLTDLRGAKAAVLGVGGAARAVVVGLDVLGVRVTVYGRDPAKTARFAAEFGVEGRPFNEAAEARCDLLINTTPIGMAGWQGEERMPITAEVLTHCEFVYDLVYNPLETGLLRAARVAGARTISGLEMLIAQAAEQFQLWTGTAAPVDVMRAAAIKRLTTKLTKEHEGLS